MIDALPLAVANYFAGKNARDFATAVSGFADDAVVKDEARDHVGHYAIRAWIEETTSKYDDKAEVLSFAKNEQGEIEVTAKVSGTFPGSPLTLRFNFTLRNELIITLAIGP